LRDRAEGKSSRGDDTRSDTDNDEEVDEEDPGKQPTDDGSSPTSMEYGKRKNKSNKTGTKVVLQEQESFFTDNWKTQSKMRKKEKGKSPRPAVASANSGRSATSRDIMDDVDLVLGGDTDDSEEEEDSRRWYGRKDNNDDMTVRVGRHALPRFESLLGEDEGMDELLSVERNDDGREGDRSSSRSMGRQDEVDDGGGDGGGEDDLRRRKKKKKRGGGSSNMSDEVEEEEDVVAESKKEKDKKPKKEKKEKKKKKKKKPVRPRPPSPEEEVVPVTGAAANTVRMDSNFIDDDWDSD
jgi:hypothetical protein